MRKKYYQLMLRPLNLYYTHSTAQHITSGLTFSYFQARNRHRCTRPRYQLCKRTMCLIWITKARILGIAQDVISLVSWRVIYWWVDCTLQLPLPAVSPPAQRASSVYHGPTASTCPHLTRSRLCPSPTCRIRGAGWIESELYTIPLRNRSGRNR